MAIPLLFAEAEAVVGGVGWGAIAYSSLLSVVLGWVFIKLLPDKDKLVKDLTAAKDELNKEMMKSKEAELKETRADYRSSLTQVLQACEKEHAELAQMVRDVLTELRQRRDGK